MNHNLAERLTRLPRSEKLIKGVALGVVAIGLAAHSYVQTDEGSYNTAKTICRAGLTWEFFKGRLSYYPEYIAVGQSSQNPCHYILGKRLDSQPSSSVNIEQATDAVLANPVQTIGQFCAAPRDGHFVQRDVCPPDTEFDVY